MVGTGSIGRRHASNLVDLGANVSAFSYRGFQTHEIQLPAAVSRCETLEEALDREPAAVVVANRTELHVETALKAAGRVRGLFIEKPLSHTLAGTPELRAAAAGRGLVVETGFMLRLHPNLQWIKAFLDERRLGELHYARAVVGQHLSQWRPGTDYRASYSAARLTGGVILDLVHELDLILWLMGPVTDVHAMTACVPSLQIESEAVAQIGLRLASGVLAQVHLDYVRPTYGRSLEIVGSGGVLTWDYPNGTVSLTRPDGQTSVVHRVPDAFERNDLFRGHMRQFLARLADPTLPAVSSLDDGIAALRVALAAHRSVAERSTVPA